jgi:hypothetical protein
MDGYVRKKRRKNGDDNCSLNRGHKMYMQPRTAHVQYKWHAKKTQKRQIAIGYYRESKKIEDSSCREEREYKSTRECTTRECTSVQET